MAWTESELRDRIWRLEIALGRDARRVDFADGSAVEFKTPSELKESIADLKRVRAELIASTAGTAPRPRRLVLSPGSGLTP